MTEITIDELKKHSGGDSSWVAIHGKVYDVTHFEDHPPGLEVILDHAGGDASDAFVAAGHPPSAIDYLEKLYIGPLAGKKCCGSCKQFRNDVLGYLRSEKCFKNHTKTMIAVTSLVVLVGALAYFAVNNRK